MAFRVPHHLLNDEQKTQIRKDLCVKEAKQWNHGNKFGYNKGKELHFFSVDHTTQDILLPYYYAGCFFDIPLINRKKSFHRVQGFNMLTKLRDYQEEIVEKSLQNYIRSR